LCTRNTFNSQILINVDLFHPETFIHQKQLYQYGP
jgi:hypothetical protein